MNIFFDVQGTLIAGGAARPDIREVFTEIVRMGHEIYLWSSAGPAYANRAAQDTGVADLIRNCYSKSEAIPVTVDFAVDDQPGFAARYGGFDISPFDGDPRDAELWKVVELLRD